MFNYGGFGIFGVIQSQENPLLKKKNIYINKQLVEQEHWDNKDYSKQLLQFNDRKFRQKRMSTDKNKTRLLTLLKQNNIDKQILENLNKPNVIDKLTICNMNKDKLQKNIDKKLMKIII